MKKFGENPEDPRRKELVSNVTREMNEIQKIQQKSILDGIKEWLRRSKYHRILHKSQVQIDKELDL